MVLCAQQSPEYQEIQNVTAYQSTHTHEIAVHWSVIWLQSCISTQICMTSFIAVENSTKVR
jgi:hypothetical protein